MSQQESSVSLLFRSRLQVLLEERGVSQRQLALSTGVSQQTINNYMRGVTKLPGAEELLAPSRYFGVPMEHFLTDDTKAGKTGPEAKTVIAPRSIPASEVRLAAKRMHRQIEELRAEAERLERLGGTS